MMPHPILASFVAVSSCACALADELALGELGFPLEARHVEIAWSLATNRLPRSLNLYKVIPAKFSPEMISNLVAIGEFAAPGKVHEALLPAALKGKDSSFEEKPAHKGVLVAPRSGRASYYNVEAMAAWGQPVIGVPGEEEVLPMTLALAKRLGISPSEFARKTDSDAFSCWRDQRTQGGKVDGRLAKRTSARGIFLNRMVDGVGFSGTGTCGGLYVSFGNNGRVANLELSWRNLELKRKCPVADRAQLSRWIRSGKAVIQMEESDIGKIRRLIITDMTAYYRGFSAGMEQTWVYPFASLDAVAHIGDRVVPTVLFCPIIQE